MSNIHGLGSLKKNAANGGQASDSESDENDRQAFYAGGSDHSGQQVLGPTGGDIANRLFAAARRAGAEEISPEETVGGQTADSSSTVFQGGAYRLGGHGQASEQISFSQTPESDNATSARNTVIVNFNIWENGFSLDDGSLRDFANPENRAFLENISRGQIPQELLQRFPNRKIDFHIIRKNAPYVAPKMKPFSGEGQRLGSVVPNVVGNSSTETIELDKPSNDELKELQAKAQTSVGVRDGEPTARVQIRLPGENQPVIATFNHNHTIVDLRTFIVNARPNLAFQPFQLVTAYPPKPIEIESQTLKEAGVLNSVINIKFV